jgi:phosphoglucosamine mutase
MREIRFSADGIRGIAGKWPLTSEGAQIIGRALGQFARRYDDPVVVMGRDTRPSGRMLASNLKNGLLRQGVGVIDLGIMTTPGVAYLTKCQEVARLGVVVSASHSPAKYNGVKLIREDGLRLTDEEEAELAELVESVCKGYDLIRTITLDEQPNASRLIDRYIQDQIELCGVKSMKKLRLVLDCANGAISRVAPQVFEELGADVIPISTSLDGHNINDHCGSEHARRNPQSLIATVKQYSATYGFAFDGDGDRLVVVDEYENAYNGDDLLFVLATHFKSNQLLRRDTIVTTDIANKGLEEALKHHAIEMIRTKNGDKHLEKEIWSNNYYLGGEQVGNVIIHDGYHAAADSLYAALVLIEAILAKGILSQIVEPFCKRPQVRATIDIASEQPWEDNKIPSRIEIPLKEQEQRARVTLGQGCRIFFWRSSTEPDLFNTVVEGGYHNTLEEVWNQAVTICKTVQQAAGLRVRQPTVVDLSSRKHTKVV